MVPDAPRRGWIVGAYAAAPGTVEWDPTDEGRYLRAVSELSGFRGLELPFSGTLHAHDEPWLLDFIDPQWDLVVTLIPGTVERLRDDPTFGLASNDASGRMRALAFTAQAREAVARLNDLAGRLAVLAVEVHSAPRAGPSRRSSSTAFTSSLAELATWDWHGARVVVEHCDAWVEAHPPIKGFLTLDEEIRAVQAANDTASHSMGMVINWGRSVIEARNPDGATRHVRTAQSAGLLAGVVLSGCSATQSRLGHAWADVHLPPAAGEYDHVMDPESLLTAARIAEVLRMAETIGDRDFRGIKVAAPRTADCAMRVATVERSLDTVRAAEVHARAR